MTAFKSVIAVILWQSFSIKEELPKKVFCQKEFFHFCQRKGICINKKALFHLKQKLQRFAFADKIVSTIAKRSNFCFKWNKGFSLIQMPFFWQKKKKNSFCLIFYDNFPLMQELYLKLTGATILKSLWLKSTLEHFTKQLIKKLVILII